MKSTAKKTILITGVSSGIGWTLAKSLSSEFRIIGSIRNTKQIEKLSEELPGVEFIVMNLEHEKSIQDGFEELQQRDPQLSFFAIINNAGTAYPGAVIDLPMRDWKAQFQINVFSLIQIIQKSIPLLVPGEGRILNISSVSGLFASPFLGAYAASKFALEGLSDALRRELALLGLRVIIIEPGPLKTSIWKKNLGVKDLYPNSLFKNFLSRSDELILNIESKALDVEKIIEPVLHALKHKRPKNRYIVHRSPLLLRFMVLFMPSKWIDKLVVKNLLSKNTKIRPI